MSSHDVNTEHILTKVHGRTIGEIPICDLLIYDTIIVWELNYNIVYQVAEII